MAKAPAPKSEKPASPAEPLDQGTGASPTQPGPDEPPPNSPQTRVTPDPAVFEFPEVKALTKGQVEGLQKEALEAYLFGQRTRYDANGRLWNMRREAVDDVWRLEISVSLGGVLLGETGLPLDRLPSAEGEHQLLGVVEALAETVEQAHRDICAEQKKLKAGRE